jgi:GT2 family glycosyltransferase
MRTAVVILNWNTKDYLKRFLPALLSSMTEGAEVIVADSGSTDGSMEMMTESFPSVRQIRLGKNLGFTGGYNAAFKAVRSLPEASSLEYFVLINSDIEVSSGWLAPLEEWMDSHPDCAACAPKLHSWYDKDTFEYAGAAGGLLDRFGYPFCRGRVMKKVEKDEGQYDSPAKVFWATGACLMVRASDYGKAGGLDDRFFAHMEEIDLCWRFQLEGKSVNVVPKSVVWHLGGGTLPNDSPWKLKLNFRNNLLMLSNNLAKTYALQEVRELTPDKAAIKACRRADRTIFLRMCLDGCSAAVYLLTRKKECYKAVVEAHKEFRALRVKTEVSQVQEYADTHRRIDVPRLFPEWIIPAALLKGKSIFEYIRNSTLASI